ncbi:hypothetical protein ACFLU3_04915 [Chloroflexota bacterium]
MTEVLTDKDSRDISVALIFIQLIWIGLVIAIGVYIVVANILGEGLIQDPNEPTDAAFSVVEYLLFAIGFILVIATFFIRRWILKRNSALSDDIRPASTAGNSIGKIDSNNLRSAIARYTGGLFVCYGLIVSIGIFGLVLFMANNSYIAL